MDNIMGAVAPFFGKRDGREDPGEYLETIEFFVDEAYTAGQDKNLTVKRLVFRGKLQDEALHWYQNLSPDIRADWTMLSAAFKKEFQVVTRTELDPNRFFNALYNLKQGKKGIAQYVEEADTLFQKCPEPLKEYMGSQFVAGLADEQKLGMVQLYLTTDTSTTITFPAAKAAVIKAYSLIGRVNPFDKEKEKDEKASVVQQLTSLGKSTISSRT